MSKSQAIAEALSTLNEDGLMMLKDTACRILIRSVASQLDRLGAVAALEQVRGPRLHFAELFRGDLDEDYDTDWASDDAPIDGATFVFCRRNDSTVAGHHGGLYSASPSTPAISACFLSPWGGGMVSQRKA